VQGEGEGGELAGFAGAGEEVEGEDLHLFALLFLFLWVGLGWVGFLSFLVVDAWGVRGGSSVGLAESFCRWVCEWILFEGVEIGMCEVVELFLSLLLGLLPEMAMEIVYRPDCLTFASSGGFDEVIGFVPLSNCYDPD
jgi:hypothetical protein